MTINLSRRNFIKTSAAVTSTMLCTNFTKNRDQNLLLQPTTLLGDLKQEVASTPLKNSTWFSGNNIGDGLYYQFSKGALSDYTYLTADMLLDGKYMCAFLISLQEGDDGPTFTLNFKLLNQCSARIRAKLSWVDQNGWKMPREGAWLKPVVGGDRVDLKLVDRMTFTIFRNGEQAVRFCLTDFTATKFEPDLLTDLVLPKSKLVDELGQSTLHEWPGKSRNREHVTDRLLKQHEPKEQAKWPNNYSRWGGMKKQKFQATGFFNKQHDGKRWWLVDPDGYAFWSAGCDCVRVDTAANYTGLSQALSWLPPEDGDFEAIYSNRRDSMSINYLAANLIFAFGKETWYKKWAAIALAQLKKIGFNTVANWSDWQIAQKAGFPYVRPLSLRLEKTKKIYRDFPDVFSPAYEHEASEYAQQLQETKDDPAFIGYFLMNEPTWGFSSESPAQGMLFNTPECATRTELSLFLEKKYQTIQSLSDQWNINTSFEEIKSGQWTKRLTPAAISDLENYSEIMCERFFKVLTDACKQVDNNHMNLGARYHKVPPFWALKGMRFFDVFSMNCYRERIPHEDLKKVNKLLELPTMIGEFHFGALDVGLPATGIGHVKDQKARGQAYRIYVEDAAADPNCIGTHWFTLYDQSVLGRGDGENYNIGFLDICQRPYQELVEAARKTHEQIYDIANGEIEIFKDEPQYFQKLF